MDSKELNLKIEYIDDTVLNTNLIGINTKYFNNNYNQINDNNKNYEYFMKFKENKKKKFLTNPKLFRKLEEEKINWDLNLTTIKCSDNINKVNVYYQYSLMIKEKELSDKDLITLLIKYKYNFLNNDYPIVVIQDANGGGLVKFSMLFQEIVQNLFNNQMKYSIKIGEYTKSISDYSGLLKYLRIFKRFYY